MDIKVSVLMSVYNTESEYLKEAIESVLKQTMTQFEFIIINDASDDQTVEILDQYQDARIVRIDNLVNMGLTASLNRGLDVARGQYIARMDSDDISYLNRLELQYQYMENHPEIAVLGGWTISNGKVSKYQGRSSSEWRKVRMLIENVGIAHPTAFIRKSFLDQYNLRYDETIKKSQDYDLWTRCLEYGDIGICPHVVLEYRIHEGQISSKHGEEQASAKRIIRTRLFQNIVKQYSEQELEQFLSLEKITMTPNELSALFDKIILCNEKNKYYNSYILRRELTFVWFKIILGIYKSDNVKAYMHTHWFYRGITPGFFWYLLKNSIIRNM